MINHITLFVSDLEESTLFYSKALAPLGYKITSKEKDQFDYAAAGFAIEDREGKRDFWITPSKTAKIGNSFSCLAFTASNKQIVDNFYSESIKAGAKDNGAPGYRPEYHAGYYAAFIIDPNGYNIEAVFDENIN